MATTGPLSMGPANLPASCVQRMMEDSTNCPIRPCRHRVHPINSRVGRYFSFRKKFHPLIVTGSFAKILAKFTKTLSRGTYCTSIHLPNNNLFFKFGHIHIRLCYTGRMASSNDHGRKFNFAAGPSALPLPVLQRAQREMLNYNNTGVSVMEMSHRSKDFQEIIDKATLDLQQLLNVPDNYKIMFIQGGGTGQFAAVAMNLIKLKPHGKADYIVTGTWSQKAAKEAEKYAKVNKVLSPAQVYRGVPPSSEWNFDPEASYIYYCANETIHGIEFHEPPTCHDPSIPLVVDMSSNMLSRHVDVSKYGVIYFGAQKNVGPAGVTCLIVREDLIGHAIPMCPALLDYRIIAANGSLHHTPPCYSIYMCGLVFEWIKQQGGLDAMEKASDKKSSALYDAIEQSDGFYVCVIDKEHRSRMNITFRIGGEDGNEGLEKKFVEEAHCNHMIQLKGHRSVGGLRASLYNAVPTEHAQQLADFMREFQLKNSPIQQ